MKLIIEDDEGRRTIVPFLGEALSIGRADDNQVRLGEKDVSRRHGRIVRVSERYIVEDLGSFTGIRVNGEKIVGKRQVNAGDLIQISEFDLQLEAGPDDLKKSETGNGGMAAAQSHAFDDGEPTPTRDDGVERRHEDTAVIKRADILPSLKTAEPVDVAAHEQPRLVGASGALRGHEFPLSRSPASLGRALENDVCLDHPQVSRSHCRLALVGGGWKVIDAESRHGVKVNGEPYAASPLHHGDVLEVGPVRLVFALPGKALALPDEAEISTPPAAEAFSGAPESPSESDASADPELARARRSKAWTRVLVSAAVLASAGAVLLFGHQHSQSSAPEVPPEVDAALQRAVAATAAHKYREAVRALQAARAAGAAPEQTRAIATLEPEAHAEEQFEQMTQAVGRGDFDAARTLLDSLAAIPTWFGSRALEQSQEVKSGYVKLHVDKANAAKGADDAACLSEANLALAVSPQNDAARSLAAECSAPAPGAARRPPLGAAAEPRHAAAVEPPAAPARPARPAASRPQPVAAQSAPPPTSASDETLARTLLRQGNTEATAGDYTAAIANFEKALRLRPSVAVLGSLYRSLGATYSRSGNADAGAHYYRLYLGYCDNPSEKAFLQKTLDDYDAARGHKK